MLSRKILIRIVAIAGLASHPLYGFVAFLSGEEALLSGWVLDGGYDAAVFSVWMIFGWIFWLFVLVGSAKEGVYVMAALMAVVLFITR